jgi:hypothetical protein
MSTIIMVNKLLESKLQYMQQDLPLHDSDECEATLLVNATNAFNILNRQVALHNIRCLCPSIATVLINSYRNPITSLWMGMQFTGPGSVTHGTPSNL